MNKDDIDYYKFCTYIECPIGVVLTGYALPSFLDKVKDNEQYLIGTIGVCLLGYGVKGLYNLIKCKRLEDKVKNSDDSSK